MRLQSIRGVSQSASLFPLANNTAGGTTGVQSLQQICNHAAYFLRGSNIATALLKTVLFILVTFVGFMGPIPEIHFAGERFNVLFLEIDLYVVEQRLFRATQFYSQYSLIFCVFIIKYSSFPNSIITVLIVCLYSFFKYFL